jgi:hypothetical protein
MCKNILALWLQCWITTRFHIIFHSILKYQEKCVKPGLIATFQPENLLSIPQKQLETERAY